MTEVRTSVASESYPRSECWCCGEIVEPTKVVHLHNHPEVSLCLRCSHFVSKQAHEIEDQGRTGYAVRLRDRLRQIRQTVIRNGWQRKPLIGRPLRWLGRWTP